MTFEDLQKELDFFIENMPSENIKPHEAEDSVSQITKLRKKVADQQLSTRNEEASAKSVKKSLFADAMDRAVGKNATEKDAKAKADEEFLRASEHEDILVAQIKYLEVMQSIMTDQLIFYRKISGGVE